MPFAKCPECGYLVVDVTKPCVSCGAEITASAVPVSPQPPMEIKSYRYDNEPHKGISKKMIAVILCTVFLVLAGGGFYYYKKQEEARLAAERIEQARLAKIEQERIAAEQAKKEEEEIRLQEAERARIEEERLTQERAAQKLKTEAEQRRQAEENEKNRQEAQSRYARLLENEKNIRAHLSFTQDKVMGFIQVTPKETPEMIYSGRDGLASTLGLSLNKGKHTMFLFCGYVAEDWLFINNILFYADQQLFRVPVESERDVYNSGDIRETCLVDILDEADGLLPFLRKAVHSKEFIIRLSGGKGYRDFIMNNTHKRAFSLIVEYFYIVQELVELRNSGLL